MVLAFPGLRFTRYPEETRWELYCHKPAQESKPDFCPRKCGERQMKTVDFHEDFPYRHPALQGEDSDRGKQSVLADVPASMVDVEYHPIRASPLHLKVARATWTHGGIESILLGESLPVDLFELLRGLCEIIHLKAKMVNAAIVGSIGAHVRIFLGLPIQDGQVNVPICEEHRAIRATPDFFEPKRLFVKSRCLVRVLGGQGNVLDLRHSLVLLCIVLGFVADTPPSPRHSNAILRGRGWSVNDKYLRCVRRYRSLRGSPAVACVADSTLSAAISWSIGTLSY